MADNRKLSEPKDIQKRLMSFDLKYQQSLYRQVAYALGEKYKGALPGATSYGSSGSFPLFPDLLPQFLRVGQSRRILNTQFIGMARVLSVDPEPEFPQVDKWVGEVRKQFYLERHRKQEWSAVYEAAFLDAEATGVGCVQIGMAVNPNSKMPCVNIQHVHSYNVVYDRHVRNPVHSRWVYAVYYMDVDDAVEAYGESARSAEITVDATGDGRPMQSVRVFEYYDKGIGGREPTHCVVLGELANDPVLREANPFGPCLPFAFFVYFLPPGMRRPMGRIPFQMSSQEAINDVVAYLRQQLKQNDFTVLDARALNAQDLAGIMSGKVPAYVRVERDVQSNMSAPAIRVPSTGVAQALLALQDMLERQFTSDSGTTEFDRGLQASNSRTLGENQLVDQRGGVQASWSDLMAAKGYQRTIDKVLYIAGMVDRDPVTVDIFGTNYMVNNPADVESYIQSWLEEESIILLDSQNLRRKDSQAEQAQRLAALSYIQPFIGKGIDPMWFIEEMLKAIGEKDPREAMGGSDQAGAVSQQGMLGGGVDAAGMPVQQGLPQSGMMALPDNGVGQNGEVSPQYAQEAMLNI